MKKIFSIWLGLLIVLTGCTTTVEEPKYTQPIDYYEPDIESISDVEVVYKEPEPVETSSDVIEPETTTFRITAYCPCEKCSGNYGRNTSTGVTATEGRTIAVDPTVIPYGTEVIINGNTYVAEDCGGAIKGNKVDIFMNSKSECINWGVRNITLHILK